MACLDATLGGESANSYGSVEDADAYFANKFSAQSWAAFPSDTREIALMEATEKLEGLKFWGRPASLMQALAFPRIYEPASNGTSIPRQVLTSCYLLALELAQAQAPAGGSGNDQADKIAEMKAASVSRFKLADYEVAFHDGAGGAQGPFESLPLVVQGLIGPWVRKGSRIIAGRRRCSLYPSTLPCPLRD